MRDGRCKTSRFRSQSSIAGRRGEERPTLKQVERFAKAVHAPIGYLFLPEPPVESVPIPDFRTAENVYSGHPTPDLLDTIYICQQRQEWYRDFARSTGEGSLAFVGSASVRSAVVSTAATIRQALRFDLEERRRDADVDRRPSPLHRAGRCARNPRDV